jgi:hypothetical protein
VTVQHIALRKSVSGLKRDVGVVVGGVLREDDVSPGAVEISGRHDWNGEVVCERLLNRVFFR